MPAGVDPKRLDKHRGFGDGFAVRYETLDVPPDPELPPPDQAIPVRVRVMVPFDEDAATMTWLTLLPPFRPIGPRPSARGRANRWMTFDAVVPAVGGYAIGASETASG